jgi:hypothetical protein
LGFFLLLIVLECSMVKTVVDLKQKLIDKGLTGLALDIDETLSWTLKWWVKEMQEKFGNPEGLSVEELIKKYRYVQNVPYWQNEEAYKYIRSNIESNDLQMKLPLIHGAEEGVREVNELVPIVAYITNRPEAVAEGTNHWLTKHGFPEALMLFRPKSIMPEDGTKWKAEVMHYLYPQISGIIDDNPSLVDNLSSDYKGTIYLYDSVEHPREGINVVPCTNWDEVVKAIKKTTDLD